MRPGTIHALVMIASLLISACGGRPSPGPAAAGATAPALTAAAPTTAASTGGPLYKDPGQPVERRLEDLLGRMTLDEKIGQMTQAENNSITPEQVRRFSIGSVLTGGGGISYDNKLADWSRLVRRYQEAALKTRLGIPLIYGIDSIHGMAHVNGATVFPHSIGLGATRDAELVRQVGRATAEEMLGAGIPWNFGPVVAVPQDIRWGRTYEAFGEDTALVGELASAYIAGFQGLPDAAAGAAAGQTLFAGATAKHYLGDGGTAFGTSTAFIDKPFLLDQGDVRLEEDALRALFLPPYKAAVDGGVMSVMLSFSSWNGTKMHANKYLVSDVLKGELGFQGFVVSDWGGIDQVDSDYDAAVVSAINAGVDMSMVPYDFARFVESLKRAVESGAVSQRRIDDAVRRILRAKLELGLFEHPYGDPALVGTVGSQAHRLLARQAVRESLVLLKNDNAALPLPKDAPALFVAGGNADSVGSQMGGWSLSWQGSATDTVEGGTSILGAIRSAVSPATAVSYEKFGEFTGRAPLGVVVIGETPYAEGLGDTADLGLSAQDIRAITNTRGRVDRLVVVLVSGRPLVITGQLDQADAWVAAWLPGTEGAGVSDVLFGDYPFTGRLPYSWPRSNAQLPLNVNNLAGRTGCAGPLFPFGYGLVEGMPAAQMTECP